MNKLENQELVLFESNRIRRQEFNGEWYYSIVDIVGILIQQENNELARRYWNKTKQRIINEENSELETICLQLKLPSHKDGKMYKTDCSNREGIFRIIQSIPSPNAEPFKQWFARLAEERIQETINPELAIERARRTYLKKGYTNEWINARIKGIPARNELTDEWDKRGITDKKDYAILTDEISTATFGISTNQHKNIKNLSKNQALRDNMSPLELALTTLAEVTTTELHRSNDSQGMAELRKDARDGGNIASVTRRNIEIKTRKPVVTSKNAIDFQEKDKLKSK